MIFTPAPMMLRFADDDVSGDLGSGEQHGRRSDGRRYAAVVVELTHAEALQCRSDGGEGVRWERQIAAA